MATRNSFHYDVVSALSPYHRVDGGAARSAGFRQPLVADDTPADDPATTPVLYGMGLVSFLCTVQVLLIGGRLDAMFTASWTLVLIPLWVLTAATYILLLCVAYYVITIQTRLIGKWLFTASLSAVPIVVLWYLQTHHDAFTTHRSVVECTRYASYPVFVSAGCAVLACVQSIYVAQLRPDVVVMLDTLPYVNNPCITRVVWALFDTTAYAAFAALVVATQHYGGDGVPEGVMGSAEYFIMFAPLMAMCAVHAGAGLVAAWSGPDGGQDAKDPAATSRLVGSALALLVYGSPGAFLALLAAKIAPQCASTSEGFCGLSWLVVVLPLAVWGVLGVLVMMAILLSPTQASRHSSAPQSSGPETPLTYNTGRSPALAGRSVNV